MTKRIRKSLWLSCSPNACYFYYWHSLTQMSRAVKS